jgi:hypothetical protein
MAIARFIIPVVPLRRTLSCSGAEKVTVNEAVSLTSNHGVKTERVSENPS